MGRGLDGYFLMPVVGGLCSFEGPPRGAPCGAARARSRTVSGGFGVGETPLPIPNRAVKPHSADGTWPSRAWESRSPPVLHSRAAPPGGSSSFRAARRRPPPPRRSGRRPHRAGARREPLQLSGRRRAARGRGNSEARAPARPVWETSQCSQPAGGDLGGRPRVRPALGWTAPGCRAMNRRDAGLRPRRDPSGATRWRGATDLPAMRVSGAGGGRSRLRGSSRSRCRGLLEEAARRCLTQRGELQRRVDGATHQLAERALLRAARCGQRGEHVFGKLRSGSDGIAHVAGSNPVRFPRNRSRPRLRPPGSATDLAEGPGGVQSPPSGIEGRPGPGSNPGHRGAARTVRMARLFLLSRGEVVPPGGRARPGHLEPSEDQMSTLVRTFSTTASVNSLVVEWPPRSIVFTPPAVVSSTLS